MISTSVKPPRRLFLISFIWFAFSLARWNNAVGGFIYDDNLVHLIADSYRVKLCFSITNAKVHKKRNPAEIPPKSPILDHHAHFFSTKTKNTVLKQDMYKADTNF